MRYRPMRYRVVKRDLQTVKNVHFLYDRRSGIERMCISYVTHMPERRTGTDNRNSDERRKDRVRESQ